MLIAQDEECVCEMPLPLSVYIDITHMIKQTSPSPYAFCTVSDCGFNYPHSQALPIWPGAFYHMHVVKGRHDLITWG